MLKKHWKIVAMAATALLLGVGYVCGVYIPQRQASEIVRQILTSDAEGSLRAIASLREDRCSGLAKKRVADALRTALRETEAADLSSLICSVANCSDTDSGVDLLADPDDLQIMREALARHKKYAEEHGYAPFELRTMSDGRVTVLRLPPVYD